MDNENNNEANAITAQERQTPTYKKYAKHLGKLFWDKSSQWDHVKQSYEHSWSLIMVCGLFRPSYSNRYSYMLMELEGEYKQEYRQQASDFIHNIERGRKVVYDKANPQRPVTSESASWQ